MARELNTFAIPPVVCSKLYDHGFHTSEDLKDIGPIDLSKETGLSPTESVQVLEIVFPPEDVKKSGLDVSSSCALDILLKEHTKAPIPTFCQQLDLILGGGIMRTKLTEICGVPGSGRTQLCLQLCANVQIPSTCGGPEGEALYIDTEGSFSIERLSQISDHTVALCKKIVKCTNPHISLDSLSTEQLLQGLHYFHCTNYLELLSIINNLEDFLILHPKIALIILDSISFHFRYGFQEPASLRTSLLNTINQSLIKMANKFNLAVVITNQMTTKVQGPDESSLVPALGESWAHACTVRLILTNHERCRKALLIKSPWRQDAEAEFEITASGVRDCFRNVCGSK